MIYNTLFVKYENSYQLRLYNFPVKSMVDNELDKYDVFGFESSGNKDNKFDVVENEVDKSFSAFDEKYHFEGRSAYVSVNRSKNKIFYYARSNNWENGYFVTLTIDPKKYDSFDYKVCSELIKKFLNRLRNSFENAYALIVPEKHKSGAFHFHGIIGGVDLIKESCVQYSGHTFKGEMIYNFCRFWDFGFTNVTKVKSSLAIEKYVTKYTTKELLNNTLYQHRYFTLNLRESPMIRFNLYDNKKLIQDLIQRDLVLFTNTDGQYNRCTYLEIKKSDEVLKLLSDYDNISNEIKNATD